MAVAIAIASATASATDKVIQVTWGSGNKVTAVISYPPGSSRAPTLFIAAERNGGMNAPLIQGFANKALRDGLVVVRFDYAYFAEKGKPSIGLVDEVDQYNAVVTEAIKDPRIDPRRIILSGKSLGSVVAHRVFKQDTKYMGEVLITPIFPNAEDADRLYPDLLLTDRTAAIIVGNAETQDAPIASIYDYLKDVNGKVMLNIVAGNEGFSLGGDTADAKRANAMNIDMALETAEYWVRQIGRILPPAPTTKPVTKPKPKPPAAAKK